MKNGTYFRVSIGMHLTKKMIVTSTEKKNKGNLFVYMCYSVL